MDASGYREERNIVGLSPRNVVYRRVRGVRAPLAWLNYRLRRPQNYALQHKFQDLDLSRVDLYHFFFSISYGRKPWMVTFSSWIPRWGKRDRRGLELLAGAPCRRLIAISQHAWTAQQHIMQEDADLLPALEQKLTILHPAQVPLIDDYADKPLDDDLVDFVFVGKQFFLKGGAAVLRVFSRLLDEGAPIRLHVISSMDHRDFTTRSSPSDVADARALMARYPKRMIDHGRLPNAQVLAVLRRSRVALMPTIADTYGYFVLEAQAAGCPVITTPVQALSEINDNDRGWLLDVPLNEIGRARRRGEDERAAFDRALEESLEAAVRDAVAHPDATRAKGRAALNRIRQHHDPEAARLALERLYAEALSS